MAQQQEQQHKQTEQTQQTAGSEHAAAVICAPERAAIVPSRASGWGELSRPLEWVVCVCVDAEA